MTLVSIISPSFNQGQWIGDNLASVQSQSHPDIEQVVMDGGSRDSTLELLNRAAENVRATSEPDAGQCDAINKAFAATNGEIVGWINSDDGYFYTDAVRDVLEVFEANPDVGVVYGHAALISVDNLLMQVLWAPPMSIALLKRHNFIIQPSVFLRRSLLDGELVDPRFDSKMDKELWLRLATQTKFHRINRILAVDRHHVTRKALAQGALAASDLRELTSIYELPTGSAASIINKAIRVGLRVGGIGAVRMAARADYAFGVQLDSGLKLLARQALVPRRRMPGGLARADAV